MTGRRVYGHVFGGKKQSTRPAMAEAKKNEKINNDNYDRYGNRVPRRTACIKRTITHARMYLLYDFSTRARMAEEKKQVRTRQCHAIIITSRVRVSAILFAARVCFSRNFVFCFA